MDQQAQTIECRMAPERKMVTCDQEAWVKARILAAIRMAVAIQKEDRVGADDFLFWGAIHGIADGAAVEIINTLEMRPAFVNLKRPSLP